MLKRVQLIRGGQTSVTYNSDWYPVAFIKLYLEPNSDPLTQEDLSRYESDTNSPYYQRTEDYLDKYNYKLVTEITFDEEGYVSLEDIRNNKSLNYRDKPLSTFESYYAYGYPSQYEHRKNKRFSVGRGEYALFRTLNVQGISKGNITINNEEGIYNDYFTNQSDVYNKEVYDRSYEKTEGNQLGYFMYLDASDAPGTITNITLPSDLCSDTRLVVSAWICDLAHSANATHADVSFIFKGINGDEQTVLTRYQSGIVPNVPYTFGSNNTGRAEWQQIYFTFTFQEPEEDYDSYVLEVANNTPNSNGADYGIDDIQVWRSTPNIQVNRRDACDASSLLISTDYSTLLNNMDWTEGQDISDIMAVASDPDLIKYRFGLRGDADNTSDYPHREMKVGNTYFSFLEGLRDVDGNLVVTDRQEDVTESNPDRVLGSDEYRWVRINKNLPAETAPEQSIYSLRVVVATDARTEQDYPRSEEAALRAERILNLRAVKDYNYLREDDHWNALWKDRTGGIPDKPDWLTTGDAIELNGLNETNVNNPENEQTYLTVIQELYSRLQIPRIHCPWLDAEDENILHLCPVDVDDTDLHYDGEILDRNENGTPIVASGEYQVILFGAIEVNGWSNGDESGPNLKDPCNLISEFTVRSTIRIRVYTDPETEGLICAGTQRQISAELLNRDTGEPLGSDAFGFDWFLGTQEEYDALTTEGKFGQSSYGVNYTLKEAIDAYRDETKDEDEFDRSAVAAWNASNENMKEGLLALLEDEDRVWLLTDKSEQFTVILESPSIVAMPFFKERVDGALYCTEITEVLFDDYSEDVPEIYPGIAGVDYPDDLTSTPVRLGLRHIEDGKSLTIPLRKDIKLVAGESHSLIKNPKNANVTLYVNNMPEVATLDALSVTQNSDQNSLTLTFNDNYTFAEGEEYTLLIPFVESADGTNALGTTCDGLARLVIKVVPDFLTWQGSNHWYDEDEAGTATLAGWKQSDEAELYRGDKRDGHDANGNDDISNFTYSPLYFTKITIPDDTELQLEDIQAGNDGKTLNITTTDNIQYDMAVDTVTSSNGITVVPYYINKVDQIYFKPEATLLNQHYLDYNKAWVDFEMTEGQAYWMASPLQDVYAGDMYAPTDGGRQETPAFTDITYNNTDNSRWNPAFYQKAWNKAITYYTDTEGTEDVSVNVNAVENNWSIEYNDVEVPYSLGKGFYARVEDVAGEKPAMVRLPKADEGYSYENPTTRAITKGRADGTDYAQLAGETVTVDLSKYEDAEDVDGNGTYFLVGNPFMAYLKMDGDNGFLKSNTNLEEKFWILDSESGSIIAGTPDVEWDDADVSTGYVAPMTAFFVQLKKDAQTKTITFSTTMTAAKPTDTETVYTRAFAATNPQLTLTAKSEAGMSRAAVVQKSDASNQYEADKDAVTLLDSELDAPTVYTVAGNYAAAVNALHDYKNVPLGVYAKDGEDVELTLEGASQLVEPLYLYDAVLRSTTPIEGDSYTLRLTGSSHGRYFLTTDEGIRAESEIRIYSPADGQLIVASTLSDPLKQVLVYDLNGRLVESRQNLGTTLCRLNVPGGIYIIRAVSGQGEEQAKLKVR